MLESYRAEVLDYSHDMKSAGHDIARTEALQKSAAADFKPKLSADGNYKYTGNPMQLSIDVPSLDVPLSFEGKHSGYGASLSLVQPVYAGGAIRQSWKKASQQHEMAVNRADMVKNDVSCQADIYYWNAVAMKEMAVVAEEYRNSVAELVEVVADRVQTQYASRNDLLMAEVKLNEAEYRLMQAVNNMEVARLQLNTLAGTDHDVVIATDSCIPVPAEDVSAVATAQFAAGSRPEVLVAEGQVKVAEAEKGIAMSAFMPQVHVGATGSYSSPGYDFNSDMDPNYAVYATVSVPIFEWGKRRQTKRAADRIVSMAENSLGKVTDAVNLEMRTAVYNYTQALEQARLSESSLQKADENEQIAMDRYREGLVSIVEALDAQMYSQQARVNNIQAKLNAEVSKAELYRAAGIYLR